MCVCCNLIPKTQFLFRAKLPLFYVEVTPIKEVELQIVGVGCHGAWWVKLQLDQVMCTPSFKLHFLLSHFKGTIIYTPSIYWTGLNLTTKSQSQLPKSIVSPQAVPLADSQSNFSLGHVDSVSIVAIPRQGCNKELCGYKYWTGGLIIQVN